MLNDMKNEWIFSTKKVFLCKKRLTGRDVPGIMIKSLNRYDTENKLYRKGLAIMKSTGIIRKVDELGRIVLPIELRRTLDIVERDELEIYMENDRIILQKFEPACVFCGSSRGLISYRRKNVCQNCVKKMTEY